MTVTTLPFDIEEIHDPTILRAIVETARGPKPGPFSGPHAGSYGVVLWGRGSIVRMWGAGHAPSEDILRAYAITRILEDHRPDHGRLIVHCKGLDDQLRHVARSRGHRADGKTPFSGYALLKPLQESRDAGTWRLRPYRTREEPEGFQEAQQSAAVGLKAALRLVDLLAHIEADRPDHAMLATDLEPDPEGILARLEASR